MSELYITLDQVPLLLVICQCIVLAIGLLSARTDKSSSNQLLAIFILLNALGAMDALLLWATPFTTILQLQPNLAHLGEIGFWLQGPVLYWYCQSLMFERHHKMNDYLIHLTPAFLFFCYLFVVFFSKSYEQKIAMLDTRDIQLGMTYMIVRSIRHLMLIGYCIATLKLISRYQTELKKSFSSIDKIDIPWLKILIIGQLATVSWGLIIHLTSLYALTNHVKVPGYDMGVAWNYLIFLLVNTLVFYSLTHATIVLDNGSDKTVVVTSDQNAVDKIEGGMTNQKHYLIHELTLDQFSERIGLSPRQVSETLHQHFQVNFFEFVNSYRVKHAQELLTDTDMPVQAVIELSGFNSKSAFNRFFKRMCGKNPRQYRQTVKTST